MVIKCFSRGVKKTTIHLDLYSRSLKFLILSDSKSCYRTFMSWAFTIISLISWGARSPRLTQIIKIFSIISLIRLTMRVSNSKSMFFSLHLMKVLCTTLPLCISLVILKMISQVTTSNIFSPQSRELVFSVDYFVKFFRVCDFKLSDDLSRNDKL